MKARGAGDAGASHPWEVDHVLRMTGPRGIALVALAGVAAPLTVASITDAASATTTPPAPTTTPKTRTTKATTTKAPAKPTKPKIICRARLVAVLPPGTSAENYGTTSCTGVAFGDGVQHDTAQLTRTSDTAGS